MRRRTLRRVAALACATIAIGTLVACSSESEPEEPSTAGPTTVTMWHQASADSGAKLAELVDEFNSSQDQYVIEPQYIAAEGFTARIVQALNSGEAPNLVVGDTNPSQLGEAIDTGKVVSIDDFFGTGEYPLQPADIPEGMLASGVFDGVTYALPTDGGCFAMFYNKAIFEEAGIDELPTTWAEVADLAAELTTDDRYGIYLPIGANEWSVFTWQAVLWSAGGEFLNEDNTEVEFNSAEGVEALSTWTTMIEEGVAYPSTAGDTNQPQGWPTFNAGKYAMFITGPYHVAPIAEALGEENVGVFPYPQISQPAMNTGTNVSYILDGTDDEEAGAYAFLSWFMQPDQQAQWDIASGYLPTNLNTVDSAAYSAFLEESPFMQVFVDQLEYARSRPSISNYAEISAALSAELERAMLLQKSPQQALDDAAAVAQEILDSNA